MIKATLIILLLIVSYNISNAQEVKLNCDSNNYAVFRKVKGDMIKVECDTIYVLNKFTFDLLYKSYNDFRNQNLLLSQYALINDSISSMYETQLDSQRIYFQTLNSYFDTLANKADTLVKNSNANINSIAGNLNEIETQVKEAKDNIAAAQDEIKLAKKEMRKQKWKWGAGGFTIGAALVFVLSIVL